MRLRTKTILTSSLNLIILGLPMPVYADSFICEACPAGTYGNGKTCTDCPAGTYSLVGSESCITCPAGQTSSAGSAQCGACKPGQYLNSTTKTCTYCSAGTYSDKEGATSCTACQESASECNSTTGESTKCKPGFGYYAGKCSKCEAGTYSPGDKSVCVTCTAGTYSSAGAASCVGCPDGQYSQNGSTTCVVCPIGATSCNKKTGEATGCEAGYGLYNGRCFECPKGQYSAGGTNQCQTCNSDVDAGVANVTVGGVSVTPQCGVKKRVTKYCQSARSKSATSNPVTSETSVTLQCPVHQTCSSYKCKDDTGYTGGICNPGYGYDHSTKNCQRCAAGTYSPGGTNMCITCPKGKYSNAGASACSDCSAESIDATSKGDKTCGVAKLKINQYCTSEGSTSNTENKNQIERYVDLGSTACTGHTYCGSNNKCAEYQLPGAATWASESGPEFICNAGYYSAGNYCARCPDNSKDENSGGKSGLTDSSQCECKDGYYKSANGRCKLRLYAYYMSSTQCDLPGGGYGNVITYNQLKGNGESTHEWGDGTHSVHTSNVILSTNSNGTNYGSNGCLSSWDGRSYLPGQISDMSRYFDNSEHCGSAFGLCWFQSKDYGFTRKDDM